MFAARFTSVCAACGRDIKLGQLCHSVSRDTYVHQECPVAVVDAVNGDDSKAEKLKSNTMGKVACDAYGNVMAVMTPAGWQEVDLPARAETDIYGNQFPSPGPMPAVNQPLLVRTDALMASIGGMGDYVAPDYSGEWWDDPTSNDDDWRDGW